MEAPFFSYVNHFMYIYLCELHYVYNIMCINQENERRTAALILLILYHIYLILIFTDSLPCRPQVL